MARSDGGTSAATNPAGPPRAAKTSSHAWVILLAAGGFVVISVVGVAWLLGTGSGMMKQSVSTMSEGSDVGKQITAAACVDTALERHRAAVPFPIQGQRDTVLDMKTVMNERLFIDACLKASRPSPELCTSIPSAFEIRKTVNWVKTHCYDRQIETGGCQQVLRAVQEHCARPHPA